MPVKTKTTPTEKKAVKVKTKKKLPAVPVTVPAELAFWTVDGVVFHSLEELADGLLVMVPRVYRYHADKDHQDFAVWVGGVFLNKTLAAELKKATTPKAAEKIIRTYLKSITS